jgi:hypothetical protein
MWKVAAVVALIAAALLEEWIALVAQNHPARVGILLGVGLLVAGGAWLLGAHTTLIVVGFLLAGGVIGWIQGLDARDHELGDYCRYGARNEAELDHCMAHVTTDEIDGLDTPAAEFAREATNECGRGSGPYCAEVAKERE